MATVDVTIRGAGVFGLSVAWSCARRGASVRVVDPAGVAAGASGGIVGALAPHAPEQWEEKKEFQLDSLLMAEPYWAEVAAISGCDPGYARTGRLQPIADQAGLELARFRIGSAEQLWRGRAIWEVIRSEEHKNWAPKSPTGWLIHDTLSARIHPRDATHALATAVIAKGGEITKEADDEGHVVWATGAKGLEEMTEKRGRLVGAGVKGQAALLAYDARTSPQLFADWVHIIPHGNGTCAVGSTTERYFDDPYTTDNQLEDIITRACAQIPALENAQVLKRWANLRPRSRTRAPMIGEHPYLNGQYVINGGFKIGFGMAPKLGEIMADLLLNGQNSIPESFQVSRNW